MEEALSAEEMLSAKKMLTAFAPEMTTATEALEMATATEALEMATATTTCARRCGGQRHYSDQTSEYQGNLHHSHLSAPQETLRPSAYTRLKVRPRTRDNSPARATVIS